MAHHLENRAVQLGAVFGFHAYRSETELAIRVCLPASNLNFQSRTLAKVTGKKPARMLPINTGLKGLAAEN